MSNTVPMQPLRQVEDTVNASEAIVDLFADLIVALVDPQTGDIPLDNLCTLCILFESSESKEQLCMKIQAILSSSHSDLGEAWEREVALIWANTPREDLLTAYPRRCKPE